MKLARTSGAPDRAVGGQGLRGRVTSPSAGTGAVGSLEGLENDAAPATTTRMSTRSSN